MSPWWLRPTSEGAENEEKEEKTDRPQAASDTAAPAAPAPERAEAATPQQPAPTPQPTAQEPHRSFWQPRPVDEHSAPAVSEASAPSSFSPSLPSSSPDDSGHSDHSGHSDTPSAPAPRMPSWASQAGLDFDRSADAEAPAAEGSHSFDPPPAEWGLHELREPRPFAGAAASGAAGRGAAASAADTEAAGSAETDLETDGEGDGETEESRTEIRKKRSRRSRGGRRKNGRVAAGTPGSPEPADEDDDDAAPDEPQPAHFAPQLPAPVTLTPRSSRSGESYVLSTGDLDSGSREIIISVPERQRPQHEERKIAVFCDFENIALGVRDSEISKFDINLILERLLEKGKIIVKKAYADWERYSDYKRPFHEAAIELIDIPQKFYSGKNSADIKMVVDAMDMSYAKEHLDTFVILSGDSDFSPLVSKLKENNKYVIGIGVKNSSSNLLVDNCDEFIYYEDIWRDSQKGPKLDGLNKKTAEAFSLMVESIQALVRENKDVLWGSMIKQTMQRKKPSFNEGYYGYSTFSELLEDAERKQIVKLKKDQRSGTYIVTGFAKSGDAGPGRRQA